MDLEQAAERAVNVFLGVQKGERVLILTDKETKEIGTALRDAARKATGSVKLMVIDSSRCIGMEPPAEAVKAMLESDVIFAPLNVSITHTKARQDACEAGARIVTMPRITEKIFIRGIQVDANKLKERTDRIGELLDKGSEVRIEAPGGTFLKFSIEGRTSFRTTGVNKEKGKFSNLPGGEAFIAPVEGSAEGVFVVDGSILGRKVDEPVKVIVEEGRAVEIEGGKLASELATLVGEAGEPGRNIAEFGIGTNDKSKLSGNVLEDEKVLGTVHIALGNNIRMGGKTEATIHVDGVILDPSFWIDGKKIMEDGKLLI